MKVITETVHDAVYLESYALSIEENDEQVAHLWKKLRHYSKENDQFDHINTSKFNPKLIQKGDQKEYQDSNYAQYDYQGKNLVEKRGSTERYVFESQKDSQSIRRQLTLEKIKNKTSRQEEYMKSKSQKSSPDGKTTRYKRP